MTVRQRPGRSDWEFSLELGTDSRTGRRRQLRRSGFTTKEAAEIAERRVLAEIDQGVRFDENPSVSAYLRDWLEVKRSKIERSSWIRYEQLIRVHVAPTIGNFKLKRIRPIDVQKAYANIETRVSIRTTEQIHTVLRSAFAQAVRWQLIPRNPCDAVEKPHPPKPEIRVPSLQETRSLLARGDDTAYGPVYWLAALTGMRAGEILGLKWEDVDFEHSLLLVRRSVRRLGRDGVVLKDTKTHHARGVWLSSQAEAVLRAQGQRQHADALVNEDDYVRQGLVFADALGRPLNPDTVTRAFTRIAGELQLKGIHLHSLRHHHATTLLVAGFAPKIVSERLGHSTTAFTQDVYGHVAPTIQAEAAEFYARQIMKETSRNEREQDVSNCAQDEQKNEWA